MVIVRTVLWLIQCFRDLVPGNNDEREYYEFMDDYRRRWIDRNSGL